MTAQPDARAVLARIRLRQTAAPAGRTIRRSPGANGILDDGLVIHTPGDVRASLDELKASYDIVNQQAKGLADWDTHYAEFVHFFEETRARTEGVSAWLRVGQGTIDAIRERARRLEEWKVSLAGRNVKILEPGKREPPPPPPGTFDGLISAAPWVIAGLVALQLVKR